MANNVHSANFLVARHSRSLVCEICESETPWSSSGEAICGTCDVEVVSGEDVIAEGVGGNGDGDGDGDEIDINRVFAWPPPAVSTSSTEDSDSLKRKHQKVVDYNFHEEEIDSSSVNIDHYKSSSTVGDRKKLRDWNIISEENMGKSRTTVKLDLNLPSYRL
ncbi:uncharacterized protein LOC143593362 [Bidens hawaiensis]|uniref:uncharacterized protein LOC143593362 n=1 Tax=Bidens hawaiensis TaxID=980011 RepID=UPI004048F4F0